MHSAEE